MHRTSSLYTNSRRVANSNRINRHRRKLARPALKQALLILSESGRRSNTQSLQPSIGPQSTPSLRRTTTSHLHHSRRTPSRTRSGLVDLQYASRCPSPQATRTVATCMPTDTRINRSLIIRPRQPKCLLCTPNKRVPPYPTVHHRSGTCPAWQCKSITAL